MPDSETESKHFFQKVFRLQLFVSIVGLAEAVPAGLQGPLRLVAPRDPGEVQSTAAGCACDVGQDGSGAVLFNGREAARRNVGGGGSMAPPFAILGSMDLNTPTDF